MISTTSFKKVSFLSILVTFFIFSCKSIAPKEQDFSKNLSSDNKYNLNSLTLSDSTSDQIVDNFLNSSCALLWTNIRELLTVGSSFTVKNQGSTMLSSSPKDTKEFHTITSNTDSDIEVSSDSILKTEIFNYYWYIDPPQNLNVLAFNKNCKALQYIVGSSLFNASYSSGSVLIGKTTYPTITLTITPEPSDYQNLSELDILKNYVAVLNPPSNLKYSITFTKDHMLIIERDLIYTTKSILGSGKEKGFNSKITDINIK